MFLYYVIINTRYRNITKYFYYNTSTISPTIYKVLRVIKSVAREVIRPAKEVDRQ